MTSTRHAEEAAGKKNNLKELYFIKRTLESVTKIKSQKQRGAQRSRGTVNKEGKALQVAA